MLAGRRADCEWLHRIQANIYYRISDRAVLWAGCSGQPDITV